MTFTSYSTDADALKVAILMAEAHCSGEVNLAEMTIGEKRKFRESLPVPALPDLKLRKKPAMKHVSDADAADSQQADAKRGATKGKAQKRKWLKSSKGEAVDAPEPKKADKGGKRAKEAADAKPGATKGKAEAKTPVKGRNPAKEAADANAPEAKQAVDAKPGATKRAAKNRKADGSVADVVGGGAAETQPRLSLVATMAEPAGSVWDDLPLADADDFCRQKGSDVD